MKNSRIVLLVFILVTLLSCGSNEPVNYTTWHCVESSEIGSRRYLVNIYKAKNDTGTYAISYFHNVSYEGEYDVIVKNTNNKLSFIPTPQQIGSSHFIIKSGSGTVNANFTIIEFDYNIYNVDDKSEIGVHVVYNR